MKQLKTLPIEELILQSQLSHKNVTQRIRKFGAELGNDIPAVEII